MEELQTPLLQDIDDGERAEMLAIACAHTEIYEKNAIIFHAGDLVREIGVIKSGSVNIENIDLWGNKSILSHVPAGQVFAETYVLCQEPLMVDVVAAEHCEILFLNLSVLVDSRNAGQPWYPKLLSNMLRISSRKNLILSDRIFCTTAKSIRGRLLTYLSALSVRNHSLTFQVPFNRQQMADYLNLDRSALSKELGKMREEGLIEFHKNSFRLKQKIKDGQ